MPRTSRFLISMSLVLGVAVVGSQAAVAAPRAPAPGHPVTVTASVPEKASLNHSFSIDVAVSGPIAGLQAQVMLDQKAAEVGGVMPSARGSKGLNPVMNHGGARIGAYGAKAFSGGKFLRIAIFPRKAGRLSIHLGRIAAVTESGRRVQIRLARSDFSRADRDEQARLPRRDRHGRSARSHRARRTSRPTRTATGSSRARTSSTSRTAGAPATATATSTTTAASTSPTCRRCSRW